MSYFQKIIHVNNKHHQFDLKYRHRVLFVDHRQTTKTQNAASDQCLNCLLAKPELVQLIIVGNPFRLNSVKMYVPQSCF